MELKLDHQLNPAPTADFERRIACRVVSAVPAQLMRRNHTPLLFKHQAPRTESPVHLFSQSSGLFYGLLETLVSSPCAFNRGEG
jgi:hypothetical protein